MLLFNDLSLPNGLVFRFIDHSVRYFGDFYRVVIDVECDITISPSFLADPGLLSKASGSLGDTVRYRRRLEQMGVPSTEKEKIAKNLINNLINNSLSYFSSSRFPEKVIVSELNRKNAKNHAISLHGNHYS